MALAIAFPIALQGMIAYRRGKFGIRRQKAQYAGKNSRKIFCVTRLSLDLPEVFFESAGAFNRPH